MNQIFGTPKNLSATANIMPRSGYITGVWVSSASATPTIAVYDSATTTTTTLVANTFTPGGGTWYPIPFRVSSGCYVVISGTVDCTFGVVPD
jgi:hypothetical protein